MITLITFTTITTFTTMSKIELFESFTDFPSDFAQIIGLVDQKKAELVTRHFKFGSIGFVTVDVKLPRFEEDDLYKDSNIRLLIPRGLCYIFADKRWVYTLYGHPKFGNPGDFCNVDIANTTKVFRSKENGECAHWGAFVLSDQMYEVYGSKNVHMVVRSDQVAEDLAVHYGETRYSYANKMAKLINLSVPDKTHVLEYLTSTGNVLCGEGCFVDSQHLVHYDSNRMYFFAVTGKRSIITDSLVRVAPTEIDNFIRSLGLNPVLESITTITKEEEIIASTHFENKDNSEGAVVSCVNSANETIYIYKHKNFDYIFKRALREQMRKYAPTQKILKRFADLHITHPNLSEMRIWALEFNAFYRQTLTDVERSTFFENWVSYNAIFSAIPAGERLAALLQHDEYEKGKKPVDVIMFVAMPGSGKSFMAKVLKGILEEKGKVVMHLEQDMYIDRGKGAAKAYDKAIETAIKDESLDYLILTKSNHNHIVRNKTYDILGKSSRNVNKTYVVMSVNDGDMRKTAEVCVKRVLGRGIAHTSLIDKSEGKIKPMSEDTIRSILFGTFVQQWEPLDENELTYNVINLEIDQSKEEVLKSFCVQSDVLGVGDFKIDNSALAILFNQIKQEDLALEKKNTKK